MQAIKTRLTDYHIKIKPSMKLMNFICTIKFDDHFSGTDDYVNDVGSNNAMPENLKNIIFKLTNQQNIITTATSSTTAKTTILNNDNDNNFGNDITKTTNHNTTRYTIDNKLLTDRKNEISSTKKQNLTIEQMKYLNEIKLNDIEIVEILKDIDENLINNQRKIQRNYEQQQHVFQSQSQSELKQQQLKKQKMLQQQENLINKVNKVKKETEIEINYNDYNTDEQNKCSNLNENETKNVESDNMNLEIELNDLIWLKKYLNKKSQMEMNNKNGTEMSSLNIAYLHELLNDCEFILPKNEIIYEKLTTATATTVNNDDSNDCKNRNHHHNEHEYENDDEKKSLMNAKRAKEMHINGKISFKNRIKYYVKQLFAILQFISIICIAFIFGFYGINNILIIDNFDYGFRLLLGVIFALITALSQLYNLAMKLVQYNDDIIREKYFEEKEKKD